MARTTDGDGLVRRLAAIERGKKANTQLRLAFQEHEIDAPLSKRKEKEKKKMLPAK